MRKINVLRIKKGIISYLNITKKEEKKLKKRNYNLGKRGRNNINKKLYSKRFWENSSYLKPEDILGSIYKLLQLNRICEKIQ